MIATGRPCTRPMPVTTPSAGRSPAVAFASRPSSTKSLPPSSHSSAMRSRRTACRRRRSSRGTWARRRASTLSASALNSSLRDMVWFLSSSEGGRPLLGERGQPFVAVLAGQHLFVARRLQRQPLVQRQPDAAVDGALRRRAAPAAPPRRSRAPASRRRRQRLGPGPPRTRCPSASARAALTRAPGQDQLLGDGDAGQPRQALRPAGAGDDAQADLGQPQLGASPPRCAGRTPAPAPARRRTRRR